MSLQKVMVVVALLCVVVVYPSRADRDDELSEITQSESTSAGRCEPLSAAGLLRLCSGLPYNETRYPNYMKHATQDEAEAELAQYEQKFVSLTRIGCSSALRLFVCTLYAPPCARDTAQPTHVAYALRPCRELCEKVKRGCDATIKR